MKTLFIGMDISKNDIKVCLLNEKGDDVAKRFAVTNDMIGANTIVSTTVNSCGELGIAKIYIGLEATSVYGWHIQYYLADSALLAPYQSSIIVFNPKIVQNFKKSLGTGLPKNDFFDAYTIAERLRFGRLPKGVEVDFRYLALQRLTRHRFHLVESIVREKNYYLNNLFLKFSGLCQEKVFSNNFGAAATAILNDYLTLDDVAVLPLDELIDILVEHGRDLFKDPKATATALKDAIDKSYRVHATFESSLNFVMKSCLENINSLQKQVKATDKAISNEIKYFRNQYLCLDSVKGIGPVLAAGLISEIAGVSRFDNDNSLAKYAGLYWSEHQSGEFTAEDTRLKRTGNQYLRYYFVQTAEQLRKYLPEYKDYYSRKFKESKTHKHKRALVLSARKAVRLVFALLREEKLYKPPAKKGVGPD